MLVPLISSYIVVKPLREAVYGEMVENTCPPMPLI